MENYDFCEELKEKMGIKELDSDELYYQLDMFVNACDMDIREGGYNNLVEGNQGFKRIYKDYYGKDLMYHFEIVKNLAVHDDSLGFRGKYNNLTFSFDNYYKSKKEGTDIKPISFFIQLRKEMDNREYSLIISSFKNKTEYDLSERIKVGQESVIKHVRFYSKRSDLESSFEVIHMFVENPKELFRTYEWQMYNKKVLFNSHEINSIENDDLLVTDKGNALKKVLK